MYVTACKFVIVLWFNNVMCQLKLKYVNLMVPRETAELEKLGELTKMLELIIQTSY